MFRLDTMQLRKLVLTVVVVVGVVFVGAFVSGVIKKIRRSQEH